MGRNGRTIGLVLFRIDEVVTRNPEAVLSPFYCNDLEPVFEQFPGGIRGMKNGE